MNSKSKIRNIFSNLLFCFKLLYDANKRIFALLISINFLTTITPIILLFLSKNIINSIISGISNQDSGLTSILLLIITYFSLNIIISFISDYAGKISMLLTQDLLKHININVMEKSTTIDISYFDIPKLFDEVNISRNNAKELHTMVFSITGVVSGVVQMILSFILALTINYWFVLLIIISLLPKYLFNKKVEIASYDFEKKQATDNRKLSYFYLLFFRRETAREMRYYDFLHYIQDKYLYLQKQLMFARNKFNNKNGFIRLLLGLPTMIVQIFISILTIINIAKKILTVGDYTYITGIFSAFHSSFDSIMSSFAMFEGYNQKISDFKKYFSFDENKSVGIKEIDDIYKIEFRNVTFTYPLSETPTLKNVSFSLNKGDKIMLVGANGAGKTTIIKLICGFYREFEGEILINGSNIIEFDFVQLRKKMAIVFQDYIIYSLTIRENVAFGDIEKLNDDQLIKQCLSAASFVLNDDDLDIYVNKDFDENGVVLSGGQRQRLAIARAYMRKPQMVLMDEPNASLDPIAEGELLEQFKTLYNKCMLIFVSHRLSNTKAMDKILVMSDGTIIEEGNHNELMWIQGEYYKMFKLQEEKYKT